jgi:uncharacterized protein YggE
MKNVNAILTSIGLMVALWLGASSPIRVPDLPLTRVDSDPVEVTGTMHTTGSAVIRVQPDKATLRLGVQTFGVTPSDSHAKNAGIVEAVLKAVRGEGVPARDIATDYFSIRPEYDPYSQGKQKVVGYWTDNTVVVTLRQVDRLSDVLMAALEAGATTVDDVTFSTNRLRELRDEARAMAVKAAMEKAQALAGAASLAVGDVQSLNENSWSYYWGSWSSRGGYTWANVQQNVMQAPSPQDLPEDGEFSLGQIVVQAQVDMSVEIGK